jgi:CheY-like chemotaxis protein
MQNGTILIVDDEEMILDVGVQMLEKLGYTVFSANNGKKAIQVYENNYMDALFLFGFK